MTNKAKYTNNSLTDLLNQKTKFNDSLSENSIRNANDINNANANINELRRLRKNAKDDEEKKRLDDLILKNEQDLNKKSSTPTSYVNDTDSNMRSLFDKDATVDYARYITGDGVIPLNWKHYKATSNEYTEFINNSAIIDNNIPVLYRDDSLDSDNGLSIPNIISFSERYPSLQLKFQDFAYCKKLGYFPNNRLIVLRRFKHGVPDNLFDYTVESTQMKYNQPISTLVTWWKPDEEIGGISLKFNEDWGNHNEGIMITLRDTAFDYIGKVGSGSKKDIAGYEDTITSLVANAVSDDFTKFKKIDGTSYTQSYKGNPNLIFEAMKRKTGGEGLKSTLTFSLTFDYEMREINNIDAGIAMIDLIANCTRMGTSVGEFRYNSSAFLESDAIKAFINGDLEKAFNKFINGFEAFRNSLLGLSKEKEDPKEDPKKGEKSIVQTVIDYATELGRDTFIHIISRYREDLKAALSVDTGLPSGIWHVTIGNPKAPIISCGDLVITGSDLVLGRELGYNDFPNEFSVTYTLTAARTRGRDEINRIFNAGRGRVYVYKEPKNNPDYNMY